MTLGSLPFVASYFASACNLQVFPLMNSPLAVALVAFFMSYLLADCVLGYLHYPEQMNLVTGWIHHSIYLVLLPILVTSGLSGAFMVFAFMELPTIVLALGYLNEDWRSEYLFGGTFFLTRIVFHQYLAYQMYHTTPHLLLPVVLIMPLHFYWFYSWLARQARLAAAKKTEKEEVVVDDCPPPVSKPSASATSIERGPYYDVYHRSSLQLEVQRMVKVAA
ncbi:hypothetical protein HDU91_004910 [Kappamyces sp. JEL0680]|nr:hypothetical protein HDU91_004910 [Kappamyces sp. JEL0680]